MATQAKDLMLGDALRRARLRRGRSLAQAARDTKIATAYLQALEDDQPLAAFPAPVYAKFFLRSYARYLELDADRLTAMFGERFGPVGPARVTVLPRKYAVLGEEATRVPATMSGRHLSLPQAILPPRLRRGPKPVRHPNVISLQRRPVNVNNPARAERRQAASAARPPRLSDRRAPLSGREPSRRVMTALLALLIGFSGLVFVVRAQSSPAATVGRRHGPPPLPQLALGGRTIFPTYRVVALYGAPSTDSLGILGIGPDAAARKLAQEAEPYGIGDRPIMPAFELIATLALSHPGPDGMYRGRSAAAAVDPYLRAIRSLKGVLILDVQPGRADFPTEARAYESYLRQPDVELALDPEWRMGPTQIPGKEIGSVDASEINRVVDWLSDLVRRNRLPQKLLVLHRFTFDMIKHPELVRGTPQVAITWDIDGFGGRSAKISKYLAFSNLKGQYYGFKLFYRQDVDMMAPLDVLNLVPIPDMVVYQ
jgi:Helix-turn-helix domain